MHSFGSTRSAHRQDHLLQTPDSFVRTSLPCLDGGLAIVHMAPAGGSAFLQYTAEFWKSGRLITSGCDRFLFCLEGSLQLSADEGAYTLSPGGYAHVPATIDHAFTASETSRAAVIERRYLQADDAGATPREVFVSCAADVHPKPLLGDEAIQVHQLLPASAEMDLAVNLRPFQPGASLSMVEIHVMEHGLLMLEGGGIYRLGSAWYPVAAGDFIWMAPFCPQWFGALGKTEAKYLIYKDANRHPLLP